MATFDASRPIVAAMATGIGRAALDFLKEELLRQGITIRYDVSPRELTAIERDVMEMEAELQAARLLTWACRLDDEHRQAQQPRSVDGQGEGRAGRHEDQQKAVQILGPVGYSKKLLVEKWMRDAKINDIYEGTQQINLFDRRPANSRLPVRDAAIAFRPGNPNMPIDTALLDILVCPETHQRVGLAPAETLDRLNAEIEAGRLRNRGGDTIENRIEEALLREDGQILYIIDDSIPIMLVDQAIELD